MLDHGHDTRLRLRQIAAQVGVHPVHLSRSFRRYYGRTMTDYVSHRRLDQARARLASRDQSIVEIALDLGFADQSHFSRAFRRLEGLTPGKYRLSVRSIAPPDTPCTSR